MNRKLIIGILIVLILSVVGGTIWLIVTRLQSNPDTTSQNSQPGTLTGSGNGTQNIVNPTGDDDDDGLINADEAIWGTNPNNPDTDGDGFRDGDEVSSNHNPTIPSPNDTLPAGFVPGQNIQPLDTLPTEQIAVDQFFEKGIEVHIAPGENLTRKYESEIPAEQQNVSTMIEFAYEQPIISKLPVPSNNGVNLLANESVSDIEGYIRTVGNTTVFQNDKVFEIALDHLVSNNDPTAMRGIATQLRVYQELLVKTSVPPSAENVHRLLLGYSELAAATYEDIATYATDPIKSITAQNQLELNNAQYLPLIETQLNSL